MGNDQLFYKRRRQEASLRRGKAKRAPYDVILIVCEGQTERNYFSELRDALCLNNAHICDGRHGSDPLSVVNCAIKNLKKDEIYDLAFCIIDRDKHLNFNDAIQKLQKGKHKEKLKKILSVPCFEFWLLLHFKYTTKSFCVAGGESNCDEVIAELKKYLPGYQKGNRKLYQSIKDSQKNAINNAERVARFQQTSANPSTEVYKLVKYLENMNTEKRANFET